MNGFFFGAFEGPCTETSIRSSTVGGTGPLRAGPIVFVANIGDNVGEDAAIIILLETNFVSSYVSKTLHDGILRISDCFI